MLKSFEEARENYVFLAIDRLLVPIGMMGYERRVKSWLGVSGLAGIGPLSVGPQAYPGFQLAARAQFYPVGSFAHGMPISAEFMFAWGSGTSDGNRVSVRTINPGVSIGYKLETRIGFTFDIHLGARFVASRVGVRSGDIETAGYSNVAEPFFRLNAGYSF
jgi:hypothetical protein